jgi:hypothetical protein
MHDGTRVTFLRCCARCSQYRWIATGRPTACLPRSPDLNPLEFYLWGHLKTLMYAVPLDNEEALHHRIVDASQTVRNYLPPPPRYLFLWTFFTYFNVQIPSYKIRHVIVRHLYAYLCCTSVNTWHYALVSNQESSCACSLYWSCVLLQHSLWNPSGLMF